MKKIKYLVTYLILLIFMICFTGCSKQTYYYIIDEGNVIITGINNKTKSIVIPNEIDGLPVNQIGSYAFANANIDYLELPDSIVIINEFAFYEANINIKSLNLPASLEEIGQNAFISCNWLEEVNIGKNVKKIATTAFYDCINLSKITVSEDNKVYKAIDNVLYSGNSLVLYPNGKKDAFFKLDDKITQIYDYAFANNQYIEEIEINDTSNLLVIGEACFLNCSKLEHIDLPKLLFQIGQNAFKLCIALKKITLGELMVDISYGLFRGCNSLEEINLLGNISSIGAYAFSETKWLKEKQAENDLVIVSKILIDGENAKGDIIIPNEVEGIAANAFINNTKITSLVLNYKCQYIDTSAFKGCDSLENISFYETSLKTIGYKAFEGCTSLTQVLIPRGVNTIMGSAFADCACLNLVIIPNTVLYIKGGAFTNGASSMIVYTDFEEIPSTWSTKIVDDGITVLTNKKLGY